MSLLNQIFNRGLIGPKCKTCLTLAISRIKLLQNKRDTQLKLMRKEIAQFLQSGQEPIARIRVEHVIREQNIWAAYEILEMFCEFVLARVPIIESQRNLFGTKYGKEFILAASELRPDTSIIEKLSVYTPSSEVKLNMLKEIAQEYNVLWDSSKTEAEFSKMPEDLLNGPKHISTVTQIPENRKESPKAAHHERLTSSQRGPVHPVQPLKTGATAVSLGPTKSKESSAEGRPVSSESIDVLEKARAAIASADRASSAARAAAQLVNLSFNDKGIANSS
ncbi:hypothetical protein L1987_10984 [Smallanthus sonchifolius]|uniref:Uncharacterized protein n=1 Tax=Smallanthus sonchifolius TaxID=185202 RepID=A0ACB9JBQ9_9ASTR|nr:hypothetical protein L1987_10984 [Smallanthus sonchifolius]